MLEFSDNGNGNGKSFRELADQLNRYTVEVISLESRIKNNPDKRPGRQGRLVQLQKTLIPNLQQRLTRVYPDSIL